MNKNDRVNLNIIDITEDGLGVAKLDRLVFFVKNAVVGDEVEAIVTKVIKDKMAFAKVEKIITASKYRVEPKCENANRCGGCMIMNLDYKKQVDIKKQMVFNNLKRIGGFTEDYISEKYDDVLTMDLSYNYRNKLQVPFSYDKNGGVKCGFYALNTHYIIETNACAISFEGAFDIISFIRDFLEKEKFPIYNEEKHEGIFREVMLRKANNKNNISLTLIVNDNDYKKRIEIYSSLAANVASKFDNIKTVTLNINTKKSNVIFGDKNIVLLGDGHIEDELNGVKYQVSPESFYQVNNKMTEKLYNTVLEYGNFKDYESVLDLYCGIGTISLQVASHVKEIVGIEIVEKAIENAKNNAKINNISNAEFEVMDVGKINVEDNDSNSNSNSGSDGDSSNNVFANKKFDTIIVDPPRKGLDTSTINFIKCKAPKKLIYVSCDSATLARDLKILCENSEDEKEKNNYNYEMSDNERKNLKYKNENKENTKYNLENFKLVDMFPHTMHIETVCLLNMNNN